MAETLHISHQLSKEEKYKALLPQLKALLHGEIYGVLDIDSDRPGAFDEIDAKYLGEITALSVIKFVHFDNVETIEAIYDPKNTALFGARALECVVIKVKLKDESEK